MKPVVGEDGPGSRFSFKFNYFSGSSICLYVLHVAVGKSRIIHPQVDPATTSVYVKYFQPFWQNKYSHEHLPWW